MENQEQCIHPEQPCASAMDDVDAHLDAQSKILQNVKNKLTQSWSSAIEEEQRCEIV